VIGEEPYAESAGDCPPPDTRAHDADLTTLARVKASGVPIVVVLVRGRPRSLTDQLPAMRALLAAWLPGTEGEGVADVLFGNCRPSGKLVGCANSFSCGEAVSTTRSRRGRIAWWSGNRHRSTKRD
jgi:beta-glucosidase